MSHQKRNCESCGRPLLNDASQRCVACKADRRAKFGKIGGMIFSAILVAAGVIFKVKDRSS